MMVDRKPVQHVHVVSATARINAAPDRVYGIIADYRNGHPQILPKQFSKLCVDAGGYGAGTVIRFSVVALGRKIDFRAVVSEPQPGRVLVERNDPPNNSVTTFTVEPGPTGRESDVTITTELPVRSGFLGAIERFATTKVLQGMYRDELELLAAVATRP
jgi:polyketide cyclase/dehydrase/lipid transport protein